MSKASAESRSKETSKKSSSGKKKEKTKRRRSSLGRFDVMPDFRPGDPIPDDPGQLSFEFRLMRRIFRWVKDLPDFQRHGVVRNGVLSMYLKQHDIERNKVWREIDLARSVVSFRNADQRLMINTLEDSPDLYRLKMEDGHFKRFIRALRQHRLYRQAKLNPVASKPAVIAAPDQHNSTTADKSQPADKGVLESLPVTTVPDLDSALAKLEQISKGGSNVSPKDIEKAQEEYLALAKDVQKKIQTLLKSSDHGHLKWEPLKRLPKGACHKPTAPKSPVRISVQDTRKPTPALQSPTPKKPVPAEKPKSKPASSPVPKSKSPPGALSKQISKAAQTLLAVAKTPPPTSSGREAPSVNSARKKEEVVKKAEVKPDVVSRVAPTVPVPSIPVAEPAAVGASSVHGSKAGTAKEIVGLSQEQNLAKAENDAENSADGTEEERSPSRIAPFRTKLPAPMGPAPSLFKILFSAIGQDLNRLPLPIAAMEPLSMLQVLCEELEYSELIDHAIVTSEPSMRMAFVAALAVSAYSQTIHRAGRKPFNPLLGETFEYHSPHLGWKYVAEQVSHHPSVAACMAEGRGWRWWQDRQFVLTFGGSSIEAKTIGCIYLTLNKWNETYRWHKVTSNISGILSGKQTIDHFGEMIVTCEQTKLTAKLQFKKIFKESRGEVKGRIIDDDDEVLQKLHGSWADSLYVDEKTGSKGRQLWRIGGLPPDAAKYYGFSRFAMSLNELRPDIHGSLPKTDSRLRPDQKALELGCPDDGDKIKADIENKQRQRKNEMSQGQRAPHKAMWFKPTGNDDGSRGARWQFTGAYWEAKSKGFQECDIPKLW